MVDWNTIAQGIGYDSEEQMLHDMYCNYRLSVTEIAEKLSSGKSTIRRRMDLYEIGRRKRGGANNQSYKRAWLHLLDQRWVRSATIGEIAKTVNLHPSTVWKFLREEGSDEILCDQSCGRFGEICDLEQHASGSTTGEVQGVHPILQKDEGKG